MSEETETVPVAQIDRMLDSLAFIRRRMNALEAIAQAAQHLADCRAASARKHPEMPPSQGAFAAAWGELERTLKARDGWAD